MSEKTPDEESVATTRPARDHGPSVPAKVIAGAVAVTAGLATTSVAGPVAGAFVAAGLTPVFERIADFDRRAAANAAETTERAAQLAGMSPQELADWAEESPERLSLLASVVEAAWRLTGQQKADALARILADGIEDDARLDIEPLFVAAIRELEPAHIQTLRTMTNGTNPKDIIEGPPVREGFEWATEHLIEVLPHLAVGMHYIVATLDRVGCIAQGFARFEVAPWWKVTPFGHQCLAYLHDLPEDPRAS